MSKNKYVIVNIQGPNVMRAVMHTHSFSDEQMKVTEALTPADFPLYLYENPETRYFFGQRKISGLTDQRDAVQILLQTYTHLEVIELLQKDTNWYHNRISMIRSLVKVNFGGY